VHFLDPLLAATLSPGFNQHCTDTFAMIFGYDADQFNPCNVEKGSRRTCDSSQNKTHNLATRFRNHTIVDFAAYAAIRHRRVGWGPIRACDYLLYIQYLFDIFHRHFTDYYLNFELLDVAHYRCLPSPCDVNSNTDELW
jgi:hypothetical protein